jgi:hypothetical protein
MSRSRAETERLDRLTGAGEGAGGGLPLPDLFSAFLVELLDNGPASTARLVGIAADKLEYKASRVTAGWGSWDALADDVLQQMRVRGYLDYDGEVWKLGGKFATGKRLVVIPKRLGKNSNAIGVTVYPYDERKKRDQAADARMRLTEFVGTLDQGLRRVDQKRTEEIRQSITEFGDFRETFPVLQDEQGRVLDGHHRRAVDPQWPAKMIRFKSDDERLQVALVANEGARWSASDWRRLADLREAVGGQQSKRDRIRDALLENPQLTHNAIAKRLDLGNSGHVTVGRVCGELIVQCTYSECGHHLTEDGKQAPGPKPPKPANEAQQRIEDLLRANPERSNKAILADAGLPEGTHRAVTEARRRLEEQGNIPFYDTRLGSDGKVRRIPGGDSDGVVQAGAIQEPSPPSQAPPHRPHAARAGRSTPPLVTTLMTRVQKFLGLWAEDAPEPESAAELRELEEMRRVIDERIAALRSPPSEDR